ncbi:hypothetical protein [Flavobacterium adhaerens]|uniref:hypothetical protein n=1 Tax=Flavobacterium adhaerens TaxID=3149043 RepID=UPI0032B391C3
MKYLVCFLLFSTTIFSQNYQYALDEAPVKSSGVSNQLEEIDYFDKAYLLPITQKGTLQKALDEHKIVRLEKGDYSGVSIVMKTGQKLYGHPSLTKVSGITIAAGSSGVYLQDLFPQDQVIKFESGGVISNCTFKSIKWAIMQGTNIMLENCTFINFSGRIQFDCSQSGYFRNNKIIKNQSGTWSNLLVMKGNSTTPSYGNVHLHTNFLTPHGDTTELSGLQSATFVGLDAEGWNLMGEGTKAMFSATNMGNVKITDFGGGSYDSDPTPSYDIEANDVFFLNKFLRTSKDVVSVNTNMFLMNGLGKYTRKSGTVTGFDLLGNLDQSNAISFNGVEQNGKMTNTNDINTIVKSVKGTKYTPWEKPNWETLPDPLGANWKTVREEKIRLNQIEDQTAYIQGLIDKNSIAELPEGIFYIKSTLKLPVDSKHGIVGQGTGKTVIVGMTDDFPLISLVGGQDSNFIFANMTLQGGNTGIYSSQDYGKHHMAFQNIKFVVFRNQKYGMHLKQMVGFDNNFLENLGFVDCTIGFFQDPLYPWANDSDTSSFVDKTMFYKNQFINCGTAVSMRATRADNLDAWVDCKFDGNDLAFDISGQNYPIIANSDFTNHKGPNIMRDAALGIYSCRFYNNKSTDAIIRGVGSIIEGCTFSDDIRLYSPTVHHGMYNYVLNSTIKGSIVRNFGATYGIFVNNALLGDSSINKIMVSVKENVPTVIIDAPSDPYPQLLVTQ